MNRQRRGGGLVRPLILIALGVVFLLNNIGIVQWDIWQIVLQLWPLLLIAIGLDILIGRRSLLGSVAVLVIVAILLAAGIWLVSTRSAVAGQVLNSQDISQTLKGATSAEVEIDPSVASLNLGNTQTMNRGDLPPDLLIIGTVSTSRDERVTWDMQMKGSTASYVLRSAGMSFFPFNGPPGERAWNLNLTPSVPLSLKVRSSVGDSQIDLTGLNVTGLDMSAGVSSSSITLPAKGNFQANIGGGIGDLAVRIPASLAARIHVSTGLGATDISPVYARQGDFYISRGFDSASDRVELSVGGGIGRVSVQQVQSQLGQLLPCWTQQLAID